MLGVVNGLFGAAGEPLGALPVGLNFDDDVGVVAEAGGWVGGWWLTRFTTRGVALGVVETSITEGDGTNTGLSASTICVFVAGSVAGGADTIADASAALGTGS